MSKLYQNIGIILTAIICGLTSFFFIDFKLMIVFLFIPIIILLGISFPLNAFNLLLFIRPLVEPLREYSLIKGVNILSVFSIFNLGLLLCASIQNKKFNFFPYGIKWMYIFLILSGFSLINSMDLKESIIGLLKSLTLISLFLLGYNLPDTIQNISKIVTTIIYSSIIPIIFGFYQLANNKGVIQDATGYMRINSTFVLSNPFAFYLGVIILLVIFQLYFFEGKYKKIKYTILFSAFICLLFTYVRAVWIAVLLSLIFFGFFNKKFRKILIFLGIISMPLLIEIITSRFDDIFNPPKYGTNSLTFRLEITKQLLFNVIPQHWVIGYGVGLAKDTATSLTKFNLLPHNDYIRILLETGILGLIGYIIFIFSILKYYIRKLLNQEGLRNINICFLGMFIFYLIVSLGQNCFSYISVSGYVFCVLGFSIKMNEISIEKTVTEKFVNY